MSTPNELLAEGAKTGDAELAQLALRSFGANQYNCAMAQAARNGHKNIVKLMLEKGADDYVQAMPNAAEGGHIDVVRILLEKGTGDYLIGSMVYAAHGGRAFDVVEHFLFWK